MNAKYVKGQRVKIILIKNQHLKLKYPELEQYVNEIGTVVDSYWMGFDELPHSATRISLKDYYIYSICLDKEKRELKGIMEDALEAID